MTELLTESFCERCGTRYTFEAGQRTRGSGSRLRVLSQGLKTFIANDDTSFSEAMAAARSDEERSIAARQMDAFHKTFNFCFSCRQYICGNCWNEAAGVCLTCQPLTAEQWEPGAQAPDAATAEAWSVAAEPAFAEPLVVEPLAVAEPLVAEPLTLAEPLQATDVAEAPPEPLTPPTSHEAPASATAGTGHPTTEPADRAPAGPLPGSPPILRPRLEAVAHRRPDLRRLAEAADLAEAEESATPFSVESQPAAEPVEAGVSSEPAVEVAPAPDAAPEEPVEAALPSLATEAAVPSPDADVAAAPAEPVTEAAGTPTALDEDLTPDELFAIRGALAAVPGSQPAEAAEEVPVAAEAMTEAATAAAPAMAPVEPPALETPVTAERAAAEEPEPSHPAVLGRFQTSGLLSRYRPAAKAPHRASAGATGTAAPAAGSEESPAPLVDRPLAEAPAEPPAPATIAASGAVPQPPAPARTEPPSIERRLPATTGVPPSAPAGAPPARDQVSQPVWSMVAPDTEEQAAPAWPPAARAGGRALDMPPSAWASRLATARPDDLWAMSSQDVVTGRVGTPAPTVRPCAQCGLALSANARFCRRCGASQV